MSAARKTPERTVTGFGFDAERSPYHFAVVAAPGDGPVAIEERFGCDGGEETRPPALKVTLDGYRWSRIAEQARANFNKRLRDDSLPTAKWKAAGDTVLAAHLGKELTLLAWAVEDADPTLIPNMVANWLGLAPEERWWLYTTINATAGHAQYGRERGWRKAIKIAFAENPADAPPSTLLEAGHEGVRLPLPAEFQELTRRPAPAQPAAAAGPNPSEGANEAMPAHLARTVATQLERKPRRARTRAQMPLLPEGER